VNIGDVLLQRFALADSIDPMFRAARADSRRRNGSLLASRRSDFLLRIVNDAGKRTANAERSCVNFFVKSMRRFGRAAQKARLPEESGRRVRKEQPSCVIFAQSRGEPARGGPFRPANLYGVRKK
jgi:hypothetical protein